MKKINITTFFLLAYLLVMSYIGWPGRRNPMSYSEYFAIIGITVIVILLIRYLQIKLWKRKNKQKEKSE